MNALRKSWKENVDRAITRTYPYSWRSLLIEVNGGDGRPFSNANGCRVANRFGIRCPTIESADDRALLRMGKRCILPST